ncbi:MAG: class I SAM-dependent methyltransferase [Pseudomonadota bacterium]
MTDDKTALDRAYALGGADGAKALYRDWADSYDVGFAALSGYRSPARVAQVFLDERGEGPVFDAGCGTGLVAAHLPTDMVIDGFDLSAEMLDQARATGRYRTLVEGDLLAPLPCLDGAYRGVLSAGTMTNGHVDHRALAELVRVLAPGGLAVISGNVDHLSTPAFAQAFAELAAQGQISPVRDRVEAIYANPSHAPPGHGHDKARILWFRRV